MPSEFVFRISPMDATALLPQISCALEAYNEQKSRRKYPGIWRLVDRLRRVPKAPAEVRKKRRRRRTVLGLLNWCLGMYIFVPIVGAPDQLGHLLPGSMVVIFIGTIFLWRYRRILLAILSMLSAFFLCVLGYGAGGRYGILLPVGIGEAVLGLACLLTCRKPRVTAYDRAAKELLTRRNYMQRLERAYFTLTEQDLTLEVSDQPDQKYTVPLDQLTYLIETEDLFLPIYAESVTILQKRDLMTGTLDELREFLADRLVQTGL